jgi:hypothetical protein
MLEKEMGGRVLFLGGSVYSGRPRIASATLWHFDDDRGVQEFIGAWSQTGAEIQQEENVT